LSKHQRSDFAAARDELMSHVHRCGVLQAAPEQQVEWMDDTMGYMAERFPVLTEEDLGELREIGLRFCQPVIAYGGESTALSAEEDTEEQELASTV